jgi:hypothetical protein
MLLNDLPRQLSGPRLCSVQYPVPHQPPSEHPFQIPLDRLFKMRRVTKMRSVLAAHARVKGVSPTSICFKFKGQRILGDDSADSVCVVQPVAPVQRGDTQ